MSKNLVHVKYCILGYGYASLIAYHKLLKKQKHENVLILQNKKEEFFITVEYQDILFSPLPIFPVKESELYNSDLFANVPKQDPITVSFSEFANFNYNAFEMKKGSLADFMVKAQGIDKNLCLGAKQWGEEMFSLPFSQVQSKIKRHYVEPKGNTRIGYLNGQSLFKYAIEELSPKVQEYSSIQRINVLEKKIHLQDTVISYDNLISTIPLNYLFQLCGLDSNTNSAFTGCHFYFFTYESGLEENNMIYDCDYISKIIRIFSIRDDFLMVQLNGKAYNKVAISEIKDRIEVLAPSIRGIEYARDLYLPMCYPLELISDPDTLERMTYLQNNNVLPFGRFGNWEYSDLHELDWSSLDSIGV